MSVSVAENYHAPGWRARVRRWFVVLLGIATGVYLFVMMDRLKSYDPMQDDGSVITMPPGGPAPKDARVFVLVIDSLRYETAMDPTIMPNLAHLRTIGTFAQTTNIANAVTVPSVYTIFTGLEDNSLLGFVRNFVAGSTFQVEPLFEQLRRAGVQSTVCAGVQFIDFRSSIATYHLRDLRFPKERTEKEIVDAAAALARGECGLAVGHYPYTDYAAHQYGAQGDHYRAEFHRADALIHRIQERLPPGATFVVLGDHGHTADGNHSLGYGVPTAAVYTGPLFHRGLDLGIIKLASNRYLLNAAFSLPLRDYGYTGEYLPEALTTSTAVSVQNHHRSRAGRGANLRDTLIWLGFGAVVAVWLNLALPEWAAFNFSGWRGLLTMLPIAACVLPLSWVAPVTLALAVLIFLCAKRRTNAAGQSLRWTLGIVLAAWALHGWGELLSTTLELQRSTTFPAVVVVWVIGGAVGIMFATRSNRSRLGWIVLAVPGLLLLPTNSHYGWSSVMTPALLCWFAFYLRSVCAERRLAGEPWSRSQKRFLVGQAILIIFLLQAQFASEAFDYVFSGWHSLVPFWTTTNVPYMTVMGSVASFVLFCRDPHRASSRIVAMILTVLLYPLQWRVWPSSPATWVGVLSVGSVVWLIACRRRSEHAGPLGVWLGLAASGYFIRPPEPNQAAFCCVLAAIVLAVRLMRRHPQPENARADQVFLLVVGMIAVGHAMCRWSITDLEWRAAYDWFAPPQVQSFAVIVLIWIIAKGWLPWRVMRSTADNAITSVPYLRAVLAVKCASVILIMTGLGVTATSVIGTYIEAAQQAAVIGIMTLYVLL